jgi:hypothetical protein
VSVSQLYNVEVLQSGRVQHIVQHRYRDFAALHETLCDTVGERSLPTLPVRVAGCCGWPTRLWSPCRGISGSLERDSNGVTHV